MRALITNDDGVTSAGIEVLARAAADAGFTPLIAAPDEERSGSSAALSALEEGGRLLVNQATVAGMEALAVHASPAMIVFVALRGAFGEPPDVVLSGVNHGPNTGQAVLHSGTVGAALTAASHGRPAMAVSLGSDTPSRWDTALSATRQVLTWFAEHATEPCVLNVNVPDIPPDQLRGISAAQIDGFGAVQAEIGASGEGFVTITFAQDVAGAQPDSEMALLRNGWVTVTALRPPIGPAGVDLSSLTS